MALLGRWKEVDGNRKKLVDRPEKESHELRG
jgi:hypothetical protein